MESTSNPIRVTNSEYAQVEAYQKEILEIFRKDYSELK